MNCPNYEKVTEAYLLGEIDSPEWRSHLDRCPSCTAKLESESDFDLIIKHAVHDERLQTRQLEAHVRSAIRQQKSRWHSSMFGVIRYAAAAVIVFGTLALATFGYAKGKMDLTATCADAVDDHQQEIVGKAPLKWRSNPQEVEALSKRIVGDPSVPDRITPAGYHLVGARICILHGKNYMHLDFSDGSNEISLFVRHRDNSFPSRIMSWFDHGEAIERVETLTVGSTQKHDLSLVIVSSSPTPEVQKLVAQTANRL